MKLSDKAKELGVTSKELNTILNDAGYIYSSYNANLKDDALQFLAIENSSIQDSKAIPDSLENVIIVPVSDKFAVVKISINSKLEVKEISRRIFDSKVRAFYELAYQNELLETGR